MRLHKFLSQAGVASRRQAEKMIASGSVKVNDQIVTEMGVVVDPKTDKIEVNGRTIEPKKENVYLAMNKPKDTVTSRRDEFGRQTVYDLLPEDVRNIVWSVGRLDYNTEGLLIFTNDGDLTEELSHPRFEHEKEYEVVLNRTLAKEDKKNLEQGVDIGGFITSPAKVSEISGHTLNITIHEGKKRQVRRMFEKLGYQVENLKRIRIGKIKLASLNLKPGEVKEVSKDDIL